eukprot:m.9526 g.9526  ORF g.9526 m.9526 type:complete len:220 (+) comp21407_c0_seq1:64-723(+)
MHIGVLWKFIWAFMVVGLRFISAVSSEMPMQHSTHGGQHNMTNSTMQPGNIRENVNHASGHQMPMYFNTNTRITLLFEGWTLDSAGVIFGTCLAIFILSILYEVLKWTRDELMRKSREKAIEIARLKHGRKSCCSSEDVVTRLPMLDHILQTVLHVIQIFISYILMLVFMTYNVWLALSVLLGSGIAYFFLRMHVRVNLAGNPPSSKERLHSTSSEHCH